MSTATGPAAPKMVFCKKLQKELPALTFKPYPGALGERIKSEISAQAWKQWTDMAKMLINEYFRGVAIVDPAAQKFLLEQAEKFFFGEGAAPPAEFKPK